MTEQIPPGDECGPSVPLEDGSDDKNKDVYFIILIPSGVKVDFNALNYYSKNKIEPYIVLKNQINKHNGEFIEENVFKFAKRKKNRESNKATKYSIQFAEKEHVYDIKFSLKDDCFVFQPEITKGNRFLRDVIPDQIDQTIIPLYNKLDIFLEALKKENKIDNKAEKLYKDTILIYEKNKQFSLLITLFLKIYENHPDLCKELMKKFYDNCDEGNRDRLNDLKNNLNVFKNIYSNADDIVKKNKYEQKYFYGILFCYLHYYDKNNFQKIIVDFSQGNANILYEILIKYYSHFMNPLKQDKMFYDGFIKYALEKDEKGEKLEVFYRILNYIEDIESYLFVINSNKEKIFAKYNELRSKPIKITSRLKLLKYSRDLGVMFGGSRGENPGIEKSDDEAENSDEDNKNKYQAFENIENECNSIIKILKEIFEFSKRENFISINLYSPFWINLIKEYDMPDWQNISNCHKLREVYKEYNELINNLYDNRANKNEHKSSRDQEDIYSIIKNDINVYFERDEFAFLLNKNIKLCFENDQKNQKKLTNTEMLGMVESYNPYFSVKDEKDREKYKYNRETHIFDYIDFSNITTTFIKNFHNFNFEIMFEENIRDYINKITEKIIDVQTFSNIIELIRVDEIKEPDKQKEYFKILEEKYNKYIYENIREIKGNQDNNKMMNKTVRIIAKLISKIFMFEKNNRFLKEEISKLDEDIQSLIYIELITTYDSDIYKEQKNYIYTIYLEKMETREGRDNIIKLVSKLRGKDKNYFIYEKLLEKCDFTEKEFFSSNENYKIQTIYLLNESLKKEQLKLNILEIRETNKAAEYLIDVLDHVNKKLEKGTIIKKDLEKFLNIQKYEAKKQENNIKISEQTNEEHDNYAINKLDLISLIIQKYGPIPKYYYYQKKIVTINENVEKLKFVKEHLMIFHRNKFNEEINKITKILEDIEKIQIKDFNAEKTMNEIKNLLEKENLCKDIEKVKDFLLFKKIYDKAQGKDEEDRFTDANRKLKNFKALLRKKNNIEEILNNNEYKYYKDR